MRVQNHNINNDVSNSINKTFKPIVTPRNNSSVSAQGGKPELLSDTNSTQVSKDQKFSLSNVNYKDMKSDLKESLVADSKGSVNEEQLQVAVVSALLSEISEKASMSFVKNFASLTAKGEGVEDSVKLALKSLVSKAEITEADAKMINGISFRASQLDNNLDMLFDGKGGKNDITIAVDPIEIAIEKASKVISEMQSGSLKFNERSLDAPTNTVNVSGNNSVQAGDIDNIAVSSNGNRINAGSGFLWKPVSENNSKLVVLFPPSLSSSIKSAGLYTDLPPRADNVIESGNYSGIGNGSRTHFRFSKSGGQYSDGIHAVAILKDGSYVSYQIKNTASRQE